MWNKSSKQKKSAQRRRAYQELVAHPEHMEVLDRATKRKAKKAIESLDLAKVQIAHQLVTLLRAPKAPPVMPQPKPAPKVGKKRNRVAPKARRGSNVTGRVPRPCPVRFAEES